MERLYQHLIAEHLRQERQMLFLMGPRQVGKTTTSQAVAGTRRTSRYLNWDNVDHQVPIVAGPSGLAEVLGLATLREQKPLLILDEIHKYPGWRSLLKGFFDTYPGAADVLVTGSARLSAFHAGGDSLMGRYFSYRMHPLSVAELARPELGPPPGERAPAAVDDDAFDALIEFGGFPEPLQRRDRRFANRWRRLRHQQLFRDELRDLTRIQETAKVQTLAQLVIQRAGQLTSYSSLAAAVGATVDSVRRWLSVLESFYFCFAVRPWHRNVARALRKEPKYYLWDWSLITGDAGARFENLVACALLKACHFWTDYGYGEVTLHFLRDKEKREVDFLVARDASPWLLVEAKLSERARLSSSLEHFRSQTGADLALQVVLDLPFVDRDCFALTRPMVVPARTFLSQLV
jgi:predicted AAA+ superfamily ATPase